MKYLGKLPLALTLICILAAAALAGETDSPPCAPGELSSPPCVVQSVDDVTVIPGETSDPPAQPVVTVTDIAETVLWSLLLF